jgi:hypothetical protein
LNRYDLLATKTFPLLANRSGWKVRLTLTVGAGERNSGHELSSLLDERALIVNILNLWCHHPPENDLFNSNNVIWE